MSRYNLLELASKQPHVRKHKEAIKTLLLIRGAALYEEIEEYLVTPGVTGRVQFDHALVADRIKAYANRIVVACGLVKDKGGIEDPDFVALEGYVEASIVKELSHADIWRHVPSILEGLGMEMHRGKIVGLLADKSTIDVVEEEITE